MTYLPTRISAYFLLFALFLGPQFERPAAADDFTMSVGAVSDLPTGVRDSIGAQAQQTSNNMLNYMLLKLDEVNRVCTLSGAQRIKLKVAAKGAVEYSIQEWLDAMTQQFGAQLPVQQNANAAAALNQAARLAQLQQAQAMPVQAQGELNINVGAAALPVAQPAAVARDQALAQAMAALARQTAEISQQLQQVQGQQNLAAQANALAAQLAQLQQQRQQLQQAMVQQQLQVAQQRQMTVVEEVVVNENGVNRVVRRVRSVPAAQGSELAAVAQQHVWLSSVEATLTSDQKKLLADADRERTTTTQNAATPTAKIVLQIDQHLLLDPAQRAKITELVNTTIELPIFKVQVQRSPQLTPAIVDRIIRRIPSADMLAILSPMQTARWQQALQSSLPQGAQNGAVDVVNPANRMPVPPMQAPPPVPVPLIR